jgi:hypothetical protein
MLMAVHKVVSFISILPNVYTVYIMAPLKMTITYTVYTRTYTLYTLYTVYAIVVVVYTHYTRI